MDTTTTREKQQQASTSLAALTSLTNEYSSSEDADNSMNSTSMQANHPPLKTNTATTRLGICEVCAAKPACYCCPKCEVKTCCLACSHIHKGELNCNGIRDRTKFIHLRSMSKQDFMSDYYFLEECTRYTEDRKLDRIKSYTRRYQQQMPVHVRRLLKAAYKRRIHLKKSLPHFTRYKENTTVYNWKLHKIYWRVEWIFINAIKTTKTPNDINVNNDDVASASFVRYVDESCDGQETLGALLDKYMNSKLEYKELSYYQSAGINGLKLFLRAERLPNVSNQVKQYFELNIAKSLNANLANKTVIEYPSIYVSYEQQPAGFDVILDSDDNLDNKTKYNSNIDGLLKKPEPKPNSVKINNEQQAKKDENEDAPTFASAGKTIATQNIPSNLLFYESNDDDDDDDDDNNDKEITSMATIANNDVAYNY